MRAARSALLLLLAWAALAAEPLVCRGFAAGLAADAIAGRNGRLVLLDGAIDRQRALWLALPGTGSDAAAQAMAHALGCWWSLSDGCIRLGLAPRLAPGQQEVRAYPSPLVGRLAAEAIALRLMDPWLGGAGGLVLNPADGSWSATLDRDGHAQVTALLTILGSGRGVAPALLPDPDDPGPTLALTRGPAGTSLGAWAIDLARCSGLAVSLGPATDPSAPAPVDGNHDLGTAMAALARAGLQAAVIHGCVCIGAAAPDDRRHPAQRRSLALVPVAHLCRSEADLEEFAAQLAARIGPDRWRLPGWGIVPVPWTRALLIAGDPAAIHAVLTAIETADGIGLAAWLR